MWQQLGLCFPLKRFRFRLILRMDTPNPPSLEPLTRLGFRVRPCFCLRTGKVYWKSCGTRLLDVTFLKFKVGGAFSCARFPCVSCQTCETSGPKNTTPPYNSKGSHTQDFQPYILLLSGCRNYGPFLDPYYNTAPNI